MCKTEKKNLINLFGSNEDMKKKKNCRKTWNGLLPNFFFSLSHNTTNCIVTGKAGRQRVGARHDMVR